MCDILGKKWETVLSFELNTCARSGTSIVREEDVLKELDRCEEPRSSLASEKKC